MAIARHQGDYMGALEGFRVLDLGLLVQGPQAALTLGDMGADVIKIELPMMGDQGRWLPSSLDDPRPPWFIGCNRGKRSVTIDLRTPQGAEAFLKLVETSDVVISNFKPGTLDEWGIGYEQAAERNPRIVYGMGSTLGPQGPAATREGADLAGQAAGGLISTTGVEGGEPTPVGATIADHMGAQNMTAGILAALLSRERTGEGQKVEVSLFGSVIYAQASEYTAYFLTGEVPGPANYGHPVINAAYGILRTQDGYMALVGVPPANREAFYAAVEMPELADDDRFQPLLYTAEVKRELFELLQPRFLTRTTADWSERLGAAGCRFAPVNDYAQAAEDPHAWDNGYLQMVEHPEYGAIRMIGSPITMSGTPVEPGQIAPELGMNTEEVLLELGYDWDQIGELRDSGAI